jgi:hypothetical protein
LLSPKAAKRDPGTAATSCSKHKFTICASGLQYCFGGRGVNSNARKASGVNDVARESMLCAKFRVVRNRAENRDVFVHNFGLCENVQPVCIYNGIHYEIIGPKSLEITPLMLLQT